MTLLKTFADIFLPPVFTIQKKFDELTLSPVKLDKPTVDAQTFIELQRLIRTKNDWTHGYGVNPAMEPLKESFRNLVVQEEESIEAFDFSLLQSFSASKSFMAWSEEHNASKYDNALEWGRNMWEGQNLAFSTEQDFQNNIAHLRGEGIGRRNEITVHNYDWHKRYAWINSGGSHHAAALIRQLVDQDRQFSCRAKLTTYRVNPFALQKVRNDFHLVIASEECITSDHKYYLSLFLSKLEIDMSTLGFPARKIGLRIYAIPKKQRNGTDKPLGKWIDHHVKQGNFVCFYEFITKPQIFFA